MVCSYISNSSCFVQAECVAVIIFFIYWCTCVPTGIGYADLENRVPCSVGTVMRIASISKSLTATAVARVWENGRLDLDAAVQKYVPEFPEKHFEGKDVRSNFQKYLFLAQSFCFSQNVLLYNSCSCDCLRSTGCKVYITMLHANTIAFLEYLYGGCCTQTDFFA